MSVYLFKCLAKYIALPTIMLHIMLYMLHFFLKEIGIPFLKTFFRELTSFTPLDCFGVNSLAITIYCINRRGNW